MDAVLYSSARGTLVLVPACFEPSMELEELHGRLHLCCRLDLANKPASALCRRLFADFDRCSYALVSQHDATRLLGSRALWGSSDRRCSPREVRLSGEQVRKRVSLFKHLANKPTSTA
jgi:hypothetical protein